MTEVTKPLPLVRWVQVAGLPADGQALHIETDQRERDALAAFCGVDSIERLTADMVIRPWLKDGAAVTGNVIADIVQTCVVTLEPVHNRIEEVLSVRYLPEAEAARLANEESVGNREEEIDLEDQDPPEPFQGDEIDIGAMICEVFALGIDPYPRAAGVEFDAALAAVEDRAPVEESPFSVLRDLKRR